jgi:hypothetical protein
VTVGEGERDGGGGKVAVGGGGLLSAVGGGDCSFLTL